MSKQLDKLIEKYPRIIQDVSYEGNTPNGDGTWLYLNPGWYTGSTETGTIHEHTIAEVVDCFRWIYQDKEGWIEDNPSDINEVEKIRAGEYDDPRKVKGKL